LRTVFSDILFSDVLVPPLMLFRVPWSEVAQIIFEGQRLIACPQHAKEHVAGIPLVHDGWNEGQGV